MENIEYTILDERLKDSEIYAHIEFEDLRGYISGKSYDEIIKIQNSIHKCKCGGDIELHEFECMGDGSYLIKCKKCGKELERSQYDYDITKWDDVLNFCIRDWNNGLTTDDIKEANKKERDRIILKDDDLIWNDWLANNIIGNPVEGCYALLFKLDGGKINCIKWTIEYQKEEVSPMCVNNNVDSYILFRQAYYDVKGPLYYPNPSKECQVIKKENTFYDCGVNDKGVFIRSYKTLEEAKHGAVSRCGSNGYNKDTIIKNTKGKDSNDFVND